MDQGPSTSSADQCIGVETNVVQPVTESPATTANLASATTAADSHQPGHQQPGFIVLSPNDLQKMHPVDVDVDSVVYGFSSLSAYRPATPLEINVTGHCSPCKNTKLLQGIFGVSRKTYCHVEFTLGGDPPIRVLVSVPAGAGQRSDEPMSDTSDDDEVDLEEVVIFDYRKHFLDTVLGPAILKLGSGSRSRRKGAGNLYVNKWHIHPADWPTLSFEVERLTTDDNTYGCYLFYVALHGMQLPQDAALTLVSRYIDPYHASIVIVQCHFGVEFAMKSSVRAVLVSREAARRALKGVKFFNGLGVYDHGVSAIFPCRQTAIGSKMKSRRDDEGFVRYDPSQAGNFTQLSPSQIFGHVPVGPFVRVVLAEIFSSVTVDLLSCPAEVAAEWWLTTAARLVNVECGMSRPASSATAFTIKRLVREYGRGSVDVFGTLSISGTETYAAHDYYAKRRDHYAANPPPGPLHRFDTRQHFPFRLASERSVPDIVYRTVPVGTPTRRQLFQSCVSGAGTPPTESTVDVGAGVPKRPIVRELHVDCDSGLPIYNETPQSPQTPTTAMGQSFRRISVVSPVKQKYTLEEERTLRQLVLTKDPILNTSEGLRQLLSTPVFNKVPRSLASIRTKIEPQLF
ncbi:hypothetical protein ACI65C_013111 [Semiaphis heraclei]